MSSSVTRKLTEVPGEGRSAARSSASPRHAAAVSVTVGLLWAATATAAQLARQPGVPSVDTIWAEDGQLFLAEALRDPLGAILDPAGGYLHLGPRLLATLAAVLPLESAALVFSVGSATIVSLLSLYVFVASRALIVSPWTRAVVAGSMVVLPAALFESVANAANLQYYFLFAAFWALVARPVAWGGVAGGIAVAGTAAMSTTISLVLGPMAVWALIRAPGTRERVIAIGFLAGMLVQAVTVFRSVVLDVDPSLGAQYPIRWGESTPGDLAGLFGLRVMAGLLMGDRWVDEGWNVLGSWLPVLAVVAFGVVIALGIRRASPHVRPWVAVTLVLSVATFSLPVLARGTGHLLPHADGFSFAGNRYVLVPMWFLLTTIALVASGLGRAFPWVASSFGMVLAVSSFSLVVPRSDGPAWSTELEAAEARCASTSRERVVVPISPSFAPWRVDVTCERLS
jgi:hypothetical protein